MTVPLRDCARIGNGRVDYEKQTDNHVFAPADPRQEIVIKVKGDTVFEPDEIFSVVLTDPDNGAPGADMRGEVTIDDDDSTPTPTSNPSIPRGTPGSSTWSSRRP